MIARKGTKYPLLSSNVNSSAHSVDLVYALGLLRAPLEAVSTRRRYLSPSKTAPKRTSLVAQGPPAT